MRPLIDRRYAIVIALLLAACSKKNEPDAFWQATIKATNGEPQALWGALPPSYQADVQKLLQAAGAKMNPQVYDEGFVLLQKTVKVLETKKEFVLGHPKMKELPLPPDAMSAWEPAVRALSTLANSDIKTAEGLKALDVEKFLAGPVASSIEDFVKIGSAASSAVPGKAPKVDELRAKLAKAKITVESVDGDTAKVKIEMEGEEPEVEEMVKVEERWIPKKMAEAWPKAIAEAQANIAKIEIPPEMVVQFNAMKGVVGPVLDALLAAKTQDEFNTQIDAVAKALLGPRFAARDEEPPAMPAEAAVAPMPAKKGKAAKGKKRKRER